MPLAGGQEVSVHLPAQPGLAQGLGGAEALQVRTQAGLERRAAHVTPGNFPVCSSPPPPSPRAVPLEISTRPWPGTGALSPLAPSTCFLPRLSVDPYQGEGIVLGTQSKVSELMELEFHLGRKQQTGT